MIIGNTVNDFYNDFIAVSGIDGVSKDAVKSAAKQNQNALQRIMSVLAEIFAPLIPAIITLIPGGALYYTMQNLVIWDAERFIHYGLYTVQTVLGIAVGIIAVAAIFSVINAAFRKFKI